MSREEDLALLKAVREWRPPKELHPAAMVTWHLYEDAGMKMPPEALAELRKLLDSERENLVALAESLEGIARFVMLMQHQGDDETAQKVVDLMREYTSLFEPFWERVGEALQNVGQDAEGAFDSLTGRDGADKKAAPKFGANAPVGSMQLKNLMQPARPPPWAKKKR